MRFGVMMIGDRAVRLSGKRNNWRPTRIEPEIPPCLEHLASEVTKLGETVVVRVGHPRFDLLAGVARGEHPQETALGREAKQVADFLSVRIDESCKRLRRRGFRLPPGLLAQRVTEMVSGRHEGHEGYGR